MIHAHRPIGVRGAADPRSVVDRSPRWGNSDAGGGRRGDAAVVPAEVRRTVSRHSYGVDLYWLPLGAGGRSVRLNGRVFEAVVSRVERRSASDLYHSALVVHVPEGRFVIEVTPSRKTGEERGVVAEGAVGSRWAAPLRIFRYEVRCWRDGVIADADEAVESPRRLTGDALAAQRMLDRVPAVPAPVWGRDDLGAGEMWNSNSVVSWLIASSGLDPTPIRPPGDGRAPGWDAGVVVARRSGLPRERPANRLRDYEILTWGDHFHSNVAEEPQTLDDRLPDVGPVLADAAAERDGVHAA